jgi:hypothetical protein
MDCSPDVHVRQHHLARHKRKFHTHYNGVESWPCVAGVGELLARMALGETHRDVSMFSLDTRTRA